MRSEGYSTWFISVSVCDSNVFVLHWLDFKNILIENIKFKKYCFRKLCRERQVNKPICKLAQAYLDRVCLLCVPWRHKKSQRMACIDSRMLSTSVDSLCQTLHELLQEATSKHMPSPSISGIAHTQFAEGLHFSAFHLISFCCR